MSDRRSTVLLAALLAACALLASALPRLPGALLVSLAAAAVVTLEQRRLRATMGELRARVQDASMRLVNSNIQLLSLKELWRAMARPDEVQQFVESALSFCHRGAGLGEVAILRFDPQSEELAGQWLVPGPDAPRMHRVRWVAAALGGAVARALRTCRTCSSDGEEASTLLSVNGERPELGRDARGYIVVPLTSPMPRPECRVEAWLYRRGCPAYAAASLAGRRGGASADRPRLDLGPCISCRHFPVHGVILTTDAGREGGLRKTDQLTLESLAYAMGSLLENAALYGDVKAAERFRDHVLDGMTNGLITTDASGRVVFANRQAQRMRGEPLRQMEGRRLDELFETPAGSLPVRRVLLDQRPVLHQDALLRRAPEDRPSQPAGAGPATARIPVRVNLAPYQPQDGAAVGAVCVFEDLSGLRAMEEEIRHLDTLAAVGRFASSMAHEIRNPLGGIGAGVGYLARSQRLRPEDLEHVARIQHEIDRLDRTIRTLLAASRPAPLQLEPSRPAELAQAAAETLRGWAQERGVAVELHAAAAAQLEVHVDADLIHQLLVNLIKNAVEASPRGAAVEVEVRAAEVVAPRHAGQLPPAPQEGVEFSIHDHGGGIQEGDLPRLFEPFYTRKNGGTGLGLFVCHGIVQRHGGTIHVQSRPGEGARFTVALPRFPALMGANHEAEHSHR